MKHNKDLLLTPQGMELLADSIEAYIEIYEDVFIIPDKYKSEELKIRKAISTCKKLINKLRKHDQTVFDLDRIEEEDLI